MEPKRANPAGDRDPALWDVPPQGIIDRERLHDLTLGDEALGRELLTLFFNHSTLTLRKIREAVDGASRRAAAHALQGSAQAVAAGMIAGLPDNAGDAEWLDAVTDLHAQVAQTRAAIAHLLTEKAV